MPTEAPVMRVTGLKIDDVATRASLSIVSGAAARPFAGDTLAQRVTDTAGRRLLLVQDEKDFAGHRLGRLKGTDSTPNRLTSNFKAKRAKA